MQWLNNSSTKIITLKAFSLPQMLIEVVELYLDEFKDTFEEN